MVDDLFSYIVALGLIFTLAYAMFGGFSSDKDEKEKEELQETLIKGGVVVLGALLLLGVLTGEYKEKGGDGVVFEDKVDLDYVPDEFDTTP
jgi:hypothetical protein